jgi:hypothetical protein
MLRLLLRPNCSMLGHEGSGKFVRRFGLKLSIRSNVTTTPFGHIVFEMVTTMLSVVVILELLALCVLDPQLNASMLTAL